MPILIEWNFKRAPTWVVSDNTDWDSSTNTAWDTADALAYLSDEPAALDRFYRPYVQNFTPPYRKLATLHGGYLKWDFGSIKLSPAFFADNDQWPPPKSSSVIVWYTATTAAAKFKIMEGDVHRASFDRESVTYEIYSPKAETLLLEERENYDGDTVPMPRMFGTIAHQQPEQLPDSGAGRPTYWACSLRQGGTLGTDWHVYDDGVNIDSNVVLPTHDPYVFELTSTPVGEVTVTGPGEYGSLYEIFTWATGDERLPFELNTSLSTSPSPNVNFFATGQDLLINFLSDICAWNAHMFWSTGTILYLASMASDNNTSDLTEYHFFRSVYDDEPPVAKLTARWTLRWAVEETIGKYVKSKEQEVVVTSPYSYGAEESFTPYNTGKSTVKTRLETIRDYILKDRVEIVMPITSDIPVPCEKLSVYDDSNAQFLSAEFHAREFRLDINDDKLEVAVIGEGDVRKSSVVMGNIGIEIGGESVVWWEDQK